MQFYTISDLIRMLKLSASQLYSLIESGRLKCHRFTTKKSGGVRVSQAQLDDYLGETVSAGEATPPPPQASADKTSTADFKFLDGERLKAAWKGR
jgi:hypothetical protein